MHFATRFIVQRAQWFSIRNRLKGTLQDWGETSANKTVNAELILFLTGNSWSQKNKTFFFFSQEKWRLTAVLDGLMRVWIHEWDAASGGFLVCTTRQQKTPEPTAMPWNGSHTSEKARCHVSFTTCHWPAALQSFLRVHCLFFIHPSFSRFKILSLSLPYLLVCSPSW